MITNEEDREYIQNNNEPMNNEWGDHSYESKKDPLVELNMEPFMRDYLNRLLKVLIKYPRIYERTLGEVIKTDHVIDLMGGAKKFNKFTYRAAPAREFI